MSSAVLSVQSHVTFGYVGNKAATFPLQLHGFDVDPIHTVNFATHGGYPIVKGWRTTAQQFADIIDGLRANGLLDRYPFIITGYIGKADVLRTIASAVGEIAQCRKQKGLPLTFLCDPVLGDNGTLYVDSAAVEAYKEVIPLAQIVTPNGFEASVLTGVDVVNVDAARRAAKCFHQEGTAVVIIKSFTDEERKVDDDGHSLITLFASACKDGKETEHIIRVREVQGYFTGTGDLFAAVFLARWAKTNEDLSEALRFAVSAVLDVLKATALDQSSELRIVQSAPLILNPTSAVTVSQI